jgi:transposase
MEALMARFDWTDAEWTIIAPLLPGAEGKKNGRPRPDDRKVINGIFFVLRTGTPWRDLPERYGPYTTVYNRFNRWRRPASGFEYSKRWRRDRRSRCN